MPFFWILIDFSMNFSLFKSRKKGWAYRRWWRGERAKAASSRGTRDQRVDATWHWGHVAEPRPARVRRRWRWRMVGGHTDRSTQTPRRGATWHRRVGTRRAHGYSGALVTVGDGNAMIRKGAPLFNCVLSHYFLRVGLCSHKVFLLQDTWRYDTRRIWSRRGGIHRSREPESTRSSIKTRAKKIA